MNILAQFLLRLAFGLAVGMGITSSREVTSGYFRNHMYVTLGLSTLAALVLMNIDARAMAFAVAGAALSFFGAACWLYEAPRAGKAALWSVAACDFIAAVLSEQGQSVAATVPHEIAVATSGLVLGLVFAAMLLGHWYLNVPGMSLMPLRTLLAVAAFAVVAQAIVSALGLAASSTLQTELYPAWWLFVALRWSFGIFGVLALLFMAWRTLEVPNTQSATGILYVAVIGVFVGELTAALLSAESAVHL